MATKADTQILTPNIRLLVTKGNEEGRVYETNRHPFVIGRDPNADFQIRQDNNISRLHAKISANEDGAVWIEDLGSTNGIFVNNVRITKKTRLENGCTIIIGNTWLKFIVIRPGLMDTSAGLKGKAPETSTYFRETKKVESILILDLFDSSRMANIYGDEMALEITETLNSLALPVFNKNKADYSKGTGDGFLVTFDRPAHALEAALAVLKKVNSSNAAKKNKVPMHIRICLHHGQCIIEPNGDRHGNAVNVGFRVEGAQYPAMKKSKDSLPQRKFPEKDRIFITEDFYGELSAAEKKSFVFVGKFKLKGITGLCPVYCHADSLKK